MVEANIPTSNQVKKDINIGMKVQIRDEVIFDVKGILVNA